jgi:hypothetical protein
VPIRPGGESNMDKLLPVLAESLAKQTRLNMETVISAAVVILSHSTADDVFTEVCKLAIDLDPGRWIPLLELDRPVSLRLLKEKGFDGVFEEELQRFKNRLAGKSLPNRAEIFFSQIPIRHGDLYPRGSPEFFTMSKLKEADELRIDLVHKNGLPRCNPASGSEYTGFLHEAATVALRSLVSAYGIPMDEEYWKSLFTPKSSQATNEAGQKAPRESSDAGAK